MDNSNYKKVREYKRDTVCKILIGFVERCEAANKGEAGKVESYYTVKNASVFGSFVNSEKEKVHDLDINVEMGFSKKGEKMTEQELVDLACEYAPQRLGFIDKLFWVRSSVLRYVKASSSIISLSLDDIDQLTGRKVQIVKDGKIIKKNVIAILKKNNYPIPETLLS